MANTNEKDVNKEEDIRSRDTALALILASLLVRLLFGVPYMSMIACALCLVALVAPSAFRYPAKAWFGLAELLGGVTSKVVLGLFFYLVLTPLAVARRLTARSGPKDGRDAETMMIERNYRFAEKGWRRLF